MIISTQTSEEVLVKLMEKHIDYTAQQFHSSSKIPQEDLKSIAYISLIKCIRLYKSGRVGHFRKYTENTIKNALLNHVEKLDSYGMIKEKESLPLTEVIQGYNPFEGSIDTMWIMDIIYSLDERERIYIQRKFYDRYTDVEIGKLMGMHKTSVWRFHVKTIDKIRSMIDGESGDSEG